MNHRNRSNASWWAPEGDGPLTVHDHPELNSRMAKLEKLCENRPLYAVDASYGGTKYGQVKVKGGRIFIYSFKCEVPDSQTEARFISFPELLTRYNGGSELPKTVFFQITSDNEDPIEVIIDIEGLSRAKNFGLLCLALKGPSFKGHITSSYSYTHISSGPPPVIEGVGNSDSRTLLKEGAVYGMFSGNSFFWIQLRDELSGSAPQIGVVVSGLQDLKDLRRSECPIKECGLLI